MPGTARSAAVIKESKGHRTKAEIARREKAEQALLSGRKGIERESVKNDKAAHLEYLRLKRLMTAIGKDDELYSAGINRMSELHSEICRYQADIARTRELMAKLEQSFDEISEDCGSDEIIKFTKAFSAMLAQVNKADDIIMKKRSMLLKLEGDYCMTVSAALRTIPKDAEKKEDDPLMKVLSEM